MDDKVLGLTAYGNTLIANGISSPPSICCPYNLLRQPSPRPEEQKVLPSPDDGRTIDEVLSAGELPLVWVEESDGMACRRDTAIWFRRLLAPKAEMAM